ncbi:hypothetical protein JXM67_15570 [candidate division WOR-3 bacterium]|nr:hypothetical protein [candidate division WOR-3 bacterium]
MKKVVTISLILVAVLFAFKAGGWGGLTVSGFFPDLSGLNAEITRINHEYVGGTDEIRFNSPLFMIGAHGCGQIGPLTIGGGGAGFGIREQGDTLSAHLRYGMGYGELGFQIEPYRWLWIRPCLQIGGSGFEIELDEIIGSIGDPLQDTLYAPYHHLTTAWSFDLGAALALHLNLPITGAGFVGLEIKGGYLYPMYTSEWRDENNMTRREIEGFGIFGPYVQIAVNFGRSADVDLSWEDDDWEDF